MEFNANFYDKEYFEGSSKGGYRGRYNEIEGGAKTGFNCQLPEVLL